MSDQRLGDPVPGEAVDGSEDQGRQVTAEPALAWRCPRCLVRYPTGDYVCVGGWPRFPIALGRDEPHPPTPVETIPALT